MTDESRRPHGETLTQHPNAPEPAGLGAAVLVRPAADGTAETGGEAARVSLGLSADDEQRYRELAAEIERLDRLCWLLLEQIHIQVIHLHSPKASFDRGELADVWEEYRKKYK